MWKPVKGYENIYEVSDVGAVRRAISKKIVGQHKNYKGYWKVNLQIAGTRKLRPVHRLVAEAFVPNPDKLPFVNHISGDKGENTRWNLEWCTGSDNLKHAHRLGLRSSVGGRNGNSKLKDYAVRAIRESYKMGVPVKTLASAYGVHQTTINRAISGKRFWKNV